MITQVGNIGNACEGTPVGMSISCDLSVASLAAALNKLRLASCSPLRLEVARNEESTALKVLAVLAGVIPHRVVDTLGDQGWMLIGIPSDIIPDFDAWTVKDGELVKSE